MREIILSQGTSFILGAELRDRFGIPADITAAAFTAQMRDALNTLVATLSVTPVANRPGCGQISYGGGTAQGDGGRPRGDLRGVRCGGPIQQTETRGAFVGSPCTPTGGASAYRGYTLRRTARPVAR